MADRSDPSNRPGSHRVTQGSRKVCPAAPRDDAARSLKGYTSTRTSLSTGGSEQCDRCEQKKQQKNPKNIHNLCFLPRSFLLSRHQLSAISSYSLTRYDSRFTAVARKAGGLFQHPSDALGHAGKSLLQQQPRRNKMFGANGFLHGLDPRGKVGMGLKQRTVIALEIAQPRQ